jgi:hypothetical protein
MSRLLIVSQLIFSSLTHYYPGDEFPNYIVGWLLECEIDQCLVCTKSFEENGLKKLRCWACGNITCENCCPFEAEITEIISVGEKPVCVQCCWGQVR